MRMTNVMTIEETQTALENIVSCDFCRRTATAYTQDGKFVCDTHANMAVRKHGSEIITTTRPLKVGDCVWLLYDAYTQRHQHVCSLAHGQVVDLDDESVLVRFSGSRFPDRNPDMARVPRSWVDRIVCYIHRPVSE